jgi:cytoskeletal protein RodZ
MIDYIENNHDDLPRAEDSKLSFGPYLKKVRLEKEMSIEDIMDYSKISKHMVLQIEAENFAKLPEPVYLKGFLKTYAKALGVDPIDIIERYNRSLNKVPSTTETSRDNLGIRRVSYKTVKPPREERKGGPMIWLVFIFLVVSLVIGAFVYGNYTKNADEKPAETIQTSQDSVVVTETPASPKTATDQAADEATNGKMENSIPLEGFHLEVVCVEATTVKVSVDGGSPDEYTMKPQDHIDLNAKSMFNILIDNKCGVNLFLNNNPVTLPGKCGQSVNIQLP